MIKKEIIDHLKSFEWDTIIAKGNKLEDLNDRQWRFIKGLVIELISEKHSGPDGLVYVGAEHKDYDWPKYNLSVELKSQLSGPMYNKNGQLKKSFTVKLNNSNGTNKKEKLDKSQVADLLLVIRNDGAFVVDQKTVMTNSKAKGDGFESRLNRNSIVELSGRITVDNTHSLNIKQLIQDAIKSVI